MGRAVADCAARHADIAVVATIGRSGPWPDEFDAVVDFSAPGAAAICARICADRRKPLVCGTTGLTHEDEAALREAGSRVAVVRDSNMSAGIHAIRRVLPELARALTGFDCTIVEAHHRAKRDAPSGTARLLARALPCEPPMLSIRAGDIPGEHRVYFAGAGEEIEITHRAFSRAVFAEGALRAVRFALRAAPGLYSMQDVLESGAGG